MAATTWLRDTLARRLVGTRARSAATCFGLNVPASSRSSADGYAAVIACTIAALPVRLLARRKAATPSWLSPKSEAVGPCGRRTGTRLSNAAAARLAVYAQLRMSGTMAARTAAKSWLNRMRSSIRPASRPACVATSAMSALVGATSTPSSLSGVKDGLPPTTRRSRWSPAARSRAAARRDACSSICTWRASDASCMAISSAIHRSPKTWHASRSALVCASPSASSTDLSHVCCARLATSRSRRRVRSGTDAIAAANCTSVGVESVRADQRGGSRKPPVGGTLAPSHMHTSAMCVLEPASHCFTKRCSAVLLCFMVVVTIFTSPDRLVNSRTMAFSVYTSTYSAAKSSARGKRLVPSCARTRCGSLRTHAVCGLASGVRGLPSALSSSPTRPATAPSPPKKG